MIITSGAIYGTVPHTPSVNLPLKIPTSHMAIPVQEYVLLFYVTANQNTYHIELVQQFSV